MAVISKGIELSYKKKDALDYTVLDNLQEIQMIERDTKFNGSYVYSSKRNALIQKTQKMYEDANRKYQKAPVGTQTERRNYEKREKIKQIKDNIDLLKQQTENNLWQYALGKLKYE